MRTMCIVQQAIEHAEKKFGGDPYRLRVVMSNGATHIGYVTTPLDGVLELERRAATPECSEVTFIQIAHIASVAAIEG